MLIDYSLSHIVWSFALKHFVIETFRFDYEYESDYEYDFLFLERVMLTTRSSAILVVNRRTATRFGPITILQTPVTNLVVPKGRTRNRSRTRCQIILGSSQ